MNELPAGDSPRRKILLLQNSLPRIHFRSLGLAGVCSSLRSRDALRGHDGGDRFPDVGFRAKEEDEKDLVEVSSDRSPDNRGMGDEP